MNRTIVVNGRRDVSETFLGLAGFSVLQLLGTFHWPQVESAEEEDEEEVEEKEDDEDVEEVEVEEGKKTKKT